MSPLIYTLLPGIPVRGGGNHHTSQRLSSSRGPPVGGGQEYWMSQQLPSHPGILQGKGEGGAHRISLRFISYPGTPCACRGGERVLLFQQLLRTLAPQYRGRRQP